MVWEKSGLLGTQYHVIRLLGPNMFILDLLRNHIEVYQIDSTQPYPKIILDQPRNSVSIPHGGMAANDRFLAVPGKQIPENSPVIVCWDLASKERKVLASDRPVCPFRWFQKTVVWDNKVYGLLNRFRLIGWDGESSQMIFTVDLTNSSPGENTETFSWLEVGQESGVILTVHQNMFFVTVLSSKGQMLGTICPQLPDWCYDEDSTSMIEEVCLTDITAVIRVLNYSIPKNSICCLILTADITPFLCRRPVLGISIEAKVTTQHLEPLNSPQCLLLVNSTKVLDIQPIGIKFYDYLTNEGKVEG